MALRDRFCDAVAPGTDRPRCVLDFPHAGEDHCDSRGNRWEGVYHGDRGHIIDTALDFEGRTLVDRVAISLMVAYGRAEPDDEFSKYPASVVATFADMARAVIAQFEVTDRLPPLEAPTPDGCHHCGKPERGHAIEDHPDAGFHNWVMPTDEQRLERMRARRRANAERVALHV